MVLDIPIAILLGHIKTYIFHLGQIRSYTSHFLFYASCRAILTSDTFHFIDQGAPVAQWVKRWPTDLVRSSVEVKSSQP